MSKDFVDQMISEAGPNVPRAHPAVVEYAQQFSNPEAVRRAKLKKLREATMTLIEDAIANDELSPDDVTEVMHSVVGTPPLKDGQVVSVGFKPVDYDKPEEGAILSVTAQDHNGQRHVEAKISENDLDFVAKAATLYLRAIQRARLQAQYEVNKDQPLD